MGKLKSSLTQQKHEILRFVCCFASLFETHRKMPNGLMEGHKGNGSGWTGCYNQGLRLQISKVLRKCRNGRAQGLDTKCSEERTSTSHLCLRGSPMHTQPSLEGSDSAWGSPCTPQLSLEGSDSAWGPHAPLAQLGRV